MSPYRRRTPPEAEVALARLQEALEVYRADTQRIADDFGTAVLECVEAGATWGEVGRCLGLTKQAARAHWGPYPRESGPVAGSQLSSVQAAKESQAE